MHDEIIKENQIWLQDVICEIVQEFNEKKKNLKDSELAKMGPEEFIIYNRFVVKNKELHITDVDSLDKLMEIMSLIRLNMRGLRLDDQDNTF